MIKQTLRYTIINNRVFVDILDLNNGLKKLVEETGDFSLDIMADFLRDFSIEKKLADKKGGSGVVL